MHFLSQITLNTSTDQPNAYPFNIPVIESFSELRFSAAVTFFVGENGSGKSSLLEAIAVGMKCPTLGATDANLDPMLADARLLASQLRFARAHNPKQRLFFRAEDAMGFTKRILADIESFDELDAHYDSSLTGYAQTLAKNVISGQKQAHVNRYGVNPDARSHGEWFLDILSERIHTPGLYLLDEPETPLSPLHQLTLLSMIKQAAVQGSQFIIASHSPILMALPEAQILHFDQSINAIQWQDVEHVEITRSFLNDPASFIRHL